MLYLCGVGKPSSAKALRAYGSVIARGLMVVHDGDNSHKALVESLGLKEEIHTTTETKRIVDDKNPMEPINEVDRYLAGFIGGIQRLLKGKAPGMAQSFLLLLEYIRKCVRKGSGIHRIGSEKAR